MQTADDEEDHADSCLTCVDDDATTNLVGTQGPKNHSKEVAAAKTELDTYVKWTSLRGVAGSRENDGPEERVFEASEGEEVYTISKLFKGSERKKELRTCRVSANNCQTSELLRYREDHDSECTFLAISSAKPLIRAWHNTHKIKTLKDMDESRIIF